MAMWTSDGRIQSIAYENQMEIKICTDIMICCTIIKKMKLVHGDTHTEANLKQNSCCSVTLEPSQLEDSLN
eukprot:4594877-Ditylum_brightwellii.AAC.1